MVGVKRKTTSTLSSVKPVFDWGNEDDLNSDSEASVVSDTIETDSEEMKESASEKRIRLAKEYLEKLQHDQSKSEDEDEGEKPSPTGITGGDAIAVKLAAHAKASQGKLFHRIASQMMDFEFDQASSKSFRGHKLSVTALALSGDGHFAVTAAKDGSIVKWNIGTFEKQKLQFPAKKDDAKPISEQKKCVLSLAVDFNGDYIVSGGCDKVVRVWDAKTLKHKESFSGHRDTISSLCFRENSLMLFSGSHDRTIKHWNLKEMGYVETLFGHQSEIQGIHSLRNERVVSVSSDRSVRLWKIPEETQLVFNGAGSIDCVQMVNEQYYVTGGDAGSLTLWFNGKKKAAYTVHHAHGEGNWIASVAMRPHTDLLASGSCDGQIRLWRIDLEKRSILPVGSIPVNGFVNALAFESSGKFLVAGIGQEHRLGRWSRIGGVKNGLTVVALPELTV